MCDKITLGGNIELSGFSEIDGGSMIILKKILGSYSRKISDSFKGYEKLGVEMKKEGDVFSVDAAVTISGDEKSASSSDKNLFVAVDSALKDLEKKLN